MKNENNKLISLDENKHKSLSLQFASNELKNNKSIVLAAVKQNGLSLQFASNELKNNKSIVSHAVKQNGLSLQFASNELKNNTSIVSRAVKQNGLSLQFASNELKKNKIIILYALNQNPYILNILTLKYKLLTDIDYSIYKKIILNIIKLQPRFYKFLHIDIKKNIEIVKEIININGMVLYFTLPIIQNNIDIVLLAIKQNSRIIEFLTLDMYKNKKIILKIIDDHGLRNQYKNSNLNLLHIGFYSLNNKFTKDYINYTFIDINLYQIPTIIKEFKYFLNISDIDIVIFIELDTNLKSRNMNQFNKIKIVDKIKINDLYIQLNKVIQYSNNSCKNIKILNIMDYNALLFSHNFYKIINICINNNCNNIILSDYDSNYEINNSIYKKLNLTKDIILNNMLGSHWLNYLINTPKFLRGRQLQQSGTCWLNTIFNSLYLIEPIKKEMFLKYKEYKKTKSTNFPIKYKYLRDPKYVTNIKDIIYSIIGNLKNKILSNYSNGDYMIVLAAYIKVYNIDNMEFKKEFLKFKNKISKNEPFHKICRALHDNIIRNKVCSNKNELCNLNNLNKVCNYENNDSICDYYPKLSDESLGYIYGVSGNYLSIFDIFEKIFDIKIVSSIPQDLNNISIIIVDTDIEGYIYSKNDLNINGKIYEITSCYLGNTEHAICGIKNNNKYYIYDSNNIWIEEDWSKLLNIDYLNSDFELSDYKHEFKRKIHDDSIVDFKYRPLYIIYISK